MVKWAIGTRKGAVDMKEERAATQDGAYREFLRLLGHTIWYLRKKRGLSQAELAQRANISVGYLSRLEAGSGKYPIRPSIKALFDIATDLETDLKTIICYIED